MLLNTASQSIGAQMVSATDGSAFTGSTTVQITIDSGTQTLGSVGSGVCTHEGNGYHSYRPSQAETNGAHIAFTFVGTGAVPTTVQVFTRAGDPFTRLGAPVGASISADIAGVQSDTNDIQTRIPAALVSGRIDASVGAMASAVLTATAIAADAITDAKVASDVTIASVTGAVGSVSGAVGSVTGLTTSTIAAAVGLHAVEGTLTLDQVLKLLAAVAVGNTSIVDLGGGNATVEFEAADGATVRVSATMTGSERTAVVLTP